MNIVLIAILFLLLMAAGGLFLLLFLNKSKENNLRSMLGSSGSLNAKEYREKFKNDTTGVEFEKFKNLHRRQSRKRKKKTQPTIDELLFQAGHFTKAQKKDFERLQYLYPTVLAIIFGGISIYFYDDWLMKPLGIIVGGLLGLMLPKLMLEKKVAKRSEEIMFYLPLVIEQISIGVSSSLDIGPCIQMVVDMAEERGKRNVVTDFLVFVQQQIKSGISLPEALADVGLRSGQPELKQTFLALGQVVRHGGEISKQLMELANTVTNQRNAMIEGKIKKLELNATLPVAIVFFGFMIILITGFGIQIIEGMNG